MQYLYPSVVAMLLLCAPFLSFTQNPIWTNIQENDIVDPNGVRELFPERTAYFDLRTTALRVLLQSAPDEETSPATNSTTIIPIPFPDGEIVQFRVVRYQMLAPELAAKYPNIQNYKGVAVDNPSTTIRFDWTARGFRAMLRKDGQQIFIDPYSKGTLRYYMSYFKKDYPRRGNFQCLFEEEDQKKKIHDSHRNMEKAAGDCQLRTYRLAVATTAEYSEFHGATSPAQSSLVLAEVNTAINRVNEVYERDLSIRLVLIGNTDDLFYYDAATDPYSNSDGFTMLSQNQTNIDNVIGSANYDVGHVFSTGGGGVASLGVPCNNSFKARGVTGLGSPVGDPFYIDYVAHELGHQFGGNHTQNNSCQRSSASYEPGSASTIMGYAGICVPNVQNNSDDYFHAISIQEISSYITTDDGDLCPIKSTLNASPVATNPGDFSIPKGTPFVLSATASDPNSDPLTYCWEQWDPEIGTMPPASTSTEGPLFRSLDPTTSSERYFINLSDLANGIDPTWEELPTVARDMEFRLTVRDNNPNYGCTDEVNVNVTVTDSDPFVVLAPNTNLTLSSGQTYTVQWDEASTMMSPISCGTVDIFLSTDGGLSFPTLLLGATTNDGSQSVTIPNMITTTARIMVKCATGIFFDISDTNFKIEAGSPSYALNADPASAANCGFNSVTYTIGVSSLMGYTDPVTLSTSGLPVGASASFSPNPVIPGNSSTLTVSNLATVAEGNYNFDVNGSSTSGDKNIGLTLNISIPSPADLLMPMDGATNVDFAPTLTWSNETGATSYEVEVATDASFISVVASATVATNSWVVNPELVAFTTYFWRVRHVRDCGTDPWSTPFSFSTINCILVEGFEAGQPSGWNFNVTGSGGIWEFNNSSVGSGFSNNGSGNWATYDDDDAGNTGTNNIATATTPIVDFSNSSNIALSFSYVFDNYEPTTETVTLSITDGSLIYYWNGLAWTTITSVWLSGIDESGIFDQLIPTDLDASSLSVTLEYDDDFGFAWGFGFDDFSLCSGQTNAPCPAALTINDNLIVGDTYNAQNTITSSGTVLSGTTVTFEAGQSITLLPGFTAENGSTFTARIQSCTTARPILEERSDDKVALKENELTIYPNPFSDFTTVELQLVKENDVQIELYSLTGQKVRTITASNKLTSGIHQFQVDATDLSTGMYIVLLRVGDQLRTQKLSLIK